MPVTPQVSYLASNFVKERLLDTANDGFNQLIPGTCVEYGITPFQLSASAATRNLFIGRYNWVTLSKAGVAIQYPMAILSTAKSDSIGRNSLQVTPSTFSGNVIVSLDFWSATECSSIASNGQAMFQAIEDALAGTFSSDVSYSLVPPGLSYNDEAMVEQGVLEIAATPAGAQIFIQQIACTFLFRVIV